MIASSGATAVKAGQPNGRRARRDDSRRSGEPSLPVAILTPTGTDGRIAERVLGATGVHVRVCRTMDDVCDLLERDEAAVLLISEEALDPASADLLISTLLRQPSWSDVPIILLTGEGELSGQLPKAVRSVTMTGNVTLLERPVRVATLTTLIRSAQRARQRQLDVRNYIQRREMAEQSLRESEQRLRSAVLAAPYPLMLHVDDGEILQLSQAWTTITGYEPSSLQTVADWTRLSGHASALADPALKGAPEGVSIPLGEWQIRAAGGELRTWEFHRVPLGFLPDGRRLNLTAAVDVTAYKALVESERSARHQAEEANSAKSRFLATMSHELRTPLNAIAGYTQLIALGVRGPVTAEQREDLERISRSQAHLLSLINDILNFAKIEAGHIELQVADVPIADVLHSLEEFVEPQLRRRNVAFNLRDEVPGCVVRADPDKVRQILLNLLSNAVKFTPRGGNIAVLCTADDGSARITVTDDGQGIPRDKLDAIFEPFVQVGRDFSSPQRGTGLGLAISRDLARRMDGDLEVKSEIGGGSSFTLTLPLATTE